MKSCAEPENKYLGVVVVLTGREREREREREFAVVTQGKERKFYLKDFISFWFVCF